MSSFAGLLIALFAAALGCALAFAWRARSRHDDTPLSPLPFEADPPWHEVLGVAHDADRDSIEAAHRVRRDEHAPERVARQGAKARRQAHLRVMQLDRAYATAMRELGLGRTRIADGE
ncbi:hypothetical protein [Pseudomonas sp. CGJS7]|uniref:hypothetical protein n=1 Tax=Pseudomonas sp. CGJS7 TaxID=3109348 RepID=UPI003007FB10